MTQTLSLKAINNNPIFAPIGYEAEFKRRIFLDNFQRCMTVRTFQKTACLEIKKKLSETPTAKIMKKYIKEIKLGYSRHISNADYNGDNSKWFLACSRRDRKRIKKFYNRGNIRNLYCTKGGAVVNSRKKRVEYALEQYFWNTGGNFWNWQLDEKLIEAGFYKFMESLDYSSKNKFTNSLHSWFPNEVDYVV